MLVFLLLLALPGAGAQARGDAPSVHYAQLVFHQGTGWENVTTPFGPPASFAPAMAYDSESDRVILFKVDSWGPIGATWAYDTNTNMWTNMTTGSGPTPRVDHAMAYDSESDRVVLFGGFGQGGVGLLADTWTYDFNTNTWANMESFPKPSPRYGHSMVYDAESDRVILFGGYALGDAFIELDNETWAYDSDRNTWTNRTGLVGASGRFDHAMAYDPGADRIVLVGGSTGDHWRTSDETWAYDANTNVWTNATSPGGHPARTRHALVYDARLSKIVLFGGFGSGFAVDPPVLSTNETWSYDADTNTWTNLTTAGSPSARWNHVMAYDTESSRIVLFGGTTGGRETWLYASAPSGVEFSLLILMVAVVTVAVVAAVAVLLLRRRRGGNDEGGIGEER